MKKFALNWAGRALALLAAAGIAGIFLPGSVGGRIGCAILAVVAGASAWRCWNLASGHTVPKSPRTPTPERRPWER